MRKVIFITTSKDPLTGGNSGSNRNLKCLKDIFGDDNVFLYCIERNEYRGFKGKIFYFLTEIFTFNFNGLNLKQFLDILRMIRGNGIETVYLDTSALGIVLILLKFFVRKIEVVSYFHNVETQLAKEAFRVSKNPFLLHRILISLVNEFAVCRFSDKIICLNNRDEGLIFKLYGRKSDLIVPVTLNDSNYDSNLESSSSSSSCKVALFVGSYFFPNIEAIRWICQYIMPFVDIRLVVVGANLYKLNNLDFINDRVEIHSDVDDLSCYYKSADFMLIPIFSGAGMKVKTAEALMYGKYIIGSDETFVGYDIDDSIGFRSDNAIEIIEHINNLQLNSKFNMHSRELYLQNYTNEIAQGKFRSLFNSDGSISYF